MSENVDLYIQRYNMLVETVRVFSITLEQEYGALTGCSHTPSEIIKDHNLRHPNDITRIAMDLAKQLENLRSYIFFNMNNEFLTVLKKY